MESNKEVISFLLSFTLIIGFCVGQNDLPKPNDPIAGAHINLGVMISHSPFHMRQHLSTLTKNINTRSNELMLKDYRLIGHIEAINYFTTEEVERKARTLVQMGQMTLLFASDTDYRDTQGYGPEETLLGISSAPGTNTPVFLWNNDGFIPAPTSTSRILALMPTLRQQVCAMKKFVQEFGLTETIILTQYPSKSQVDARECGSGDAMIIDLNEGSMQNALRRIARARTATPMTLKVILLLTSHGTAKLVFEHAKSENMTQEGYLWLLSSGAVGEFKTWRIADQFPVGIFGMAYDTDMSEVIKQSVDIWSRGVATDLQRHPVLNMSNMYREIHAGSPSFKGFDDYSGYTGANVRILNLDNDRKWQEIGVWSYNSGVDMKTITWPGGIVSLPPTSPGGAVRCLNIFNKKSHHTDRQDLRYQGPRRTHSRG